MTTYHRTVYQVEVLSTGPYDADGPEELSDLEVIARDITYGDCSGQVTQISTEEVTAERMAELLEAQGSDPYFLIDKED